jgi:hypothetical protein
VGNGAAALTTPDILSAVGCDLVIMNGEPDGDYPGRGADSSNPDYPGRFERKSPQDQSPHGCGLRRGRRPHQLRGRKREGKFPTISSLPFFLKKWIVSGKRHKVVYDAKCSDVGGSNRPANRAGFQFSKRRDIPLSLTACKKKRRCWAAKSSGHFFLAGRFSGRRPLRLSEGYGDT